MPAEVVLRPGWEKDLARSPGMRSALRQAGQRAAGEAQRIGRAVARSYEATVEVANDVRVVGKTDGINAGGWIELGTGGPGPTPAHAPLRRGAEAAGLASEGVAR